MHTKPAPSHYQNQTNSTVNCCIFSLFSFLTLFCIFAFCFKCDCLRLSFRIRHNKQSWSQKKAHFYVQFDLLFIRCSSFIWFVCIANTVLLKRFIQRILYSDFHLNFFSTHLHVFDISFSVIWIRLKNDKNHKMISKYYYFVICDTKQSLVKYCILAT